MLSTQHQRHRYALYTALSALFNHPLATLVEILLTAVLWLIVITSTLFVRQLEPMASLFDQDPSWLIAMSPHASEQQVQTLVNDIATWPQVINAEIIDPEQGVEDISQALNLKEKPMWLKKDKLPAIIRLKITNHLDEVTGEALEQSLTQMNGVNSVAIDAAHDRAWSEMAAWAKQGLWALMGAMIFVSIVILFNMIERWGLRLQADIRRFYLLGADVHFAYRALTHMAIFENMVAVGIAYGVSQWLYGQYQQDYRIFIEHWLGAPIFTSPTNWSLLVWLLGAIIITAIMGWIGRHFKGLLYYRLWNHTP